MSTISPHLLDPATRASLRRRAREYREAVAAGRREGPLPEIGFVMFADGVATGWCHVLPEPADWQPGVVAVPVQGNLRVAVEGNPDAGAKRWEVVL